MDELLGLTAPAPLSLSTLAINLLLSIVLSTAVAWFYTHYGKSLSNRTRFAHTLPVLAMTTVIIISVVKSSLALSLGLVGALSIVRFRTAIKEPEELLYLFLAMAIGLGLGADQRFPTILGVLVVMGYMLVRVWVAPRLPRNNLYLNIVAPGAEASFTTINQHLLEHTDAADLRRLDRTDEALQATYLIACPDDNALAALMDDLRKHVPGCEVSFVEHDHTLGA